jgi:hypothetical protein
MLLAIAIAFIGWAAAGAKGVGNGKALPLVSRVVVVAFENEEFGQVFGSPGASTFRRLGRRCTSPTSSPDRIDYAASSR